MNWKASELASQLSRLSEAFHFSPLPPMLSSTWGSLLGKSPFSIRFRIFWVWSVHYCPFSDQRRESEVKWGSSEVRCLETVWSLEVMGILSYDILKWHAGSSCFLEHVAAMFLSFLRMPAFIVPSSLWITLFSSANLHLPLSSKEKAPNSKE